MLKLFLFFTVSTLITVVAVKAQLTDADRLVPQIIQSRGFICEIHEVETRDGYFLELHRIVVPNGKNAHRN